MFQRLSFLQSFSKFSQLQIYFSSDFLLSWHYLHLFIHPLIHPFIHPSIHLCVHLSSKYLQYPRHTDHFILRLWPFASVSYLISHVVISGKIPHLIYFCIPQSASHQAGVLLNVSRVSYQKLTQVLMYFPNLYSKAAGTLFKKQCHSDFHNIYILIFKSYP